MGVRPGGSFAGYASPPCFVGIPEPASPSGLGIALALREMACICRSSGLYLPAERFFPHCNGYFSTVTPSTPGAPRFFRTRSHASVTLLRVSIRPPSSACSSISSPFLRRSCSSDTPPHSDSPRDAFVIYPFFPCPSLPEFFSRRRVVLCVP